MERKKGRVIGEIKPGNMVTSREMVDCQRNGGKVIGRVNRKTLQLTVVGFYYGNKPINNKEEK
ncbi:MAG: hypothetical protein ACPLKP_03030 [Microgenomates group bacterium]